MRRCTTTALWVTGLLLGTATAGVVAGDATAQPGPAESTAAPAPEAATPDATSAPWAAMGDETEASAQPRIVVPEPVSALLVLAGVTFTRLSRRKRV